MRFHDACKVTLAAFLLAISLGSGSAHEGHAHGETNVRVELPAMPRGETSSDRFELVAVSNGDELTIYLDRFATNEPVADATIVAETPQGSVTATPAADGTYRLPAPWAASPGRYDIIAMVTPRDGDVDILAFAIEIPAKRPSSDSNRQAAVPGSSMREGVTDRLWSGGPGVRLLVMGIFLVGGVGGFMLARRRATVLTIAVLGLGLLSSGGSAHEGEDHSNENKAAALTAATRDTAQLLSDGSVFVPKSSQRILAIRTIIPTQATYRRSLELPGRIVPDPDASGFVQAAVSGRLSPPAGGFPRLGTPVRKGDVLAYVTPPLQAIDASDIRQRQGELDQQISIVERRFARYETLAPTGAVPRSQLDDTRLELQGLKERRAALDQTRREPEPLIAPVDGVIAEGTPVAGQIAQTNAVVFHIIDPKRLWIEALSYEALPALEHATARVGEKELKLVFRGAGLADRNQSIPVHFAIEGDVEGLRVGQFLTVLAETPDERRGIAVPRTSVVRTATGQETVFEQVAPERFEQRTVRIEPLDGQRVLLSQGIAAGKRVVVQGAELIDHIR